MALKHWGGSVPQKAVVWKCPTCGVENTGPLEQGCAMCHAGDPKQAVKVPVQAAVDRAAAREPSPATQGESFQAWWGIYEPGMDGQIGPADIARDAWEAGAAWALSHQQVLPQSAAGTAVSALLGSAGSAPAPPLGGWTVHLVPPGEGVLEARDVDPRAHATIVAALAFYLDNQLGYGAIPGQLTAAECRELIDHLKEPEPTE